MATIAEQKLKRIRVIFEDDALLVVVKPAGVAVHGGAGTQKRSLIELLRAAYDEPGDLQLAHRLDQATSGVILLTKHEAARKQLVANWDRVDKHYLAIAFGDYRGPRELDSPLADRGGPRREAKTEVRRLHALSAPGFVATLLTLKLGTGRTHQIRKHLQGAGYPVVLDDKHGDFRANRALLERLKQAEMKRPKHLFLHAACVAFRHPITHAPLRFSAEPGPEWRMLLEFGGLRNADPYGGVV